MLRQDTKSPSIVKKTSNLEYLRLEAQVAVKKYTVSLDIHVREKEDGVLPSKKAVENLVCALLLSEVARDTDTGWDVYAAQVHEAPRRKFGRST